MQEIQDPAQPRAYAAGFLMYSIGAPKTDIHKKTIILPASIMAPLETNLIGPGQRYVIGSSSASTSPKICHRADASGPVGV
jgi:hypothetical protein